MQVEFLSQFNRDLDKIKAAHIKQAIFRAVIRTESAQKISDIPNVKKLAGHKSAYRIRIGDYRIGIFVY